jgi:tryptophanyl-tRNA synthetase
MVGVTEVGNIANNYNHHIIYAYQLQQLSRGKYAIIVVVMTKPVILTGLRANNDLHIGNYFGAMLPTIEMAQQKAGDYQVNMFIPDLHSFTTPIDHDQLQAGVWHNARLFAAAGLPLDHDDILLYRQSYVPAHSEMTWILDCFTSFGELRRMTQFKDKSGLSDTRLEKQTTIDAIKHVLEMRETSQYTDDDAEVYVDTLHKALNALESAYESDVSIGLFNYPVLMASDILLYGAKYVPVGDDQSQHLEFTRDIAGRMNSKFNDLFEVPYEVSKQHEFFGKGQGLRIMDLADPTKKMSKSADSDKGVIFLTDQPGEAAQKVMSATTDNLADVKYNPIEQPGISNLLQILALLRSQSLDDVALSFQGESRYGDFKKVVADEVAAFLTAYQAKLADVDDQAITNAFTRSEKLANDHANATLLRVQQAVGLRPKD